ncbi:DUF1428 domain-containing protein [Ancylobacter sp. G4_0304]|uniref:DUF1428 domain-containing protein n=1 Tax=Ancylobacter sp. G4_0304 TaxID=3114289 RepID=UPI0039C75F3A
MSYVDGFVIAVPTANKDAYREMAEKAAPIFFDHGALQLMENWGDDVPDGKITDFRMAVKATLEETVVFSWILWPSREVRDAGMKAFMEDPRLKEMTEMPFDGKRMIFGGFAPLVDMRK